MGFGIPKKFYNIAADLDIPPMIHPATGEPVEPKMMENIFIL